jgi:hypothetical protein
MKKPIAFTALVLLAALCFAQSFNIIGNIPDASSEKPWRIQVGAFKIRPNAEKVFSVLQAASLNPAYEQYGDLTRVLVTGVAAKDVALTLFTLRDLGFKEVIIREDTASPAAGPIGPSAVPHISSLPVSRALLPSAAQTEIGHLTIKVNETKNAAALAQGKNVAAWRSSTPATAAVSQTGDISGIAMGNAMVYINDTEYIAVAVVPAEEFYQVPEEQAALLPANSLTGESGTRQITEYRTEPTFRLAYRFNNAGENKGASGTNGGIDILARGENYRWLWTTYCQGGWFYDLNGVRRVMVDGYQKDSRNGVELLVKPEFVYDKGVPYLQLRHILRNTSGVAVAGQRFGASADVMIHRNDYASLVHTPYGAYMTDSSERPSIELMLVCESGGGINPVDTLWLGAWMGGEHLRYIYNDSRSNVDYEDSAMGFSYQNIDLAAGEEKEFIVRFTLARTEE